MSVKSSYKNFILTWILILLISPKAYANDYYKIIRVIDGDTFFIDYNKDGKAQNDERSRLLGIDAFETKLGNSLSWQMKNYQLNENQVLKLGYLGKQFAEYNLLNKTVMVKFNPNQPFDKYNRHLVSIFYDNKNYEEEILKAGLAVVYKKSDTSQCLLKYQNLKKIYDIANEKETNPFFSDNIEHTRPLSDNYTYGNVQIFYINGFEYQLPSSECRTSACKALLKEINSAKESIYFAIYGIQEQPAIYNALINAKKRGVEVKGVTDMTEKNINIYSDTVSLIKDLKDIKTDYLIADKNVKDKFEFRFDIASAIMHDKFFVFDGNKVFTGSTNISDTCLGGYNVNMAILINSKKVANIFTQEFLQMYNYKFHTLKSAIPNNKNIKVDDNTIISVFFAPEHRVFKEDLHNLIINSKKSIYIEMFYLTNKDLIQDLINAHNRGVDVRVIIDATCAANRFSGHKVLRAFGIPVKTENWGGKMHSKSAVIDDKYYVTGSMNWTGKAELHNDENLLIIENIQIAQKAKEHFRYLWSVIPNIYLYKDPSPESPESIGSCFDGMDNNHNGYVDAYDFKCKPLYQNHR